MAKDNIARGLANAALTEVYEIHGIAQLTTPERLGLSPSNPMFVFDTTLETYFAYNTVMEEWVTVGSSLWGGMTGDITRQQDLVDFLHSDNITTTINKQFVSQAEKDKWNGQTNTYIVNSVAELDALSANTGDFGVVMDVDGTKGYLFNGTDWIQTTDTNWENINLKWDNISDKPDLTNLTVKWENITGAPDYSFDWRNF